MYNPVTYLGINKHLTEPGNEKKLENAIRILSLIYSNEGQATFTGEDMPCVMSAIDSGEVPENSLIYDALQAFRDGRAFRMTYAGWESNLANMGQAYKEWFRGENHIANCERTRSWLIYAGAALRRTSGFVQCAFIRRGAAGADAGSRPQIRASSACCGYAAVNNNFTPLWEMEQSIGAGRI